MILINTSLITAPILQHLQTLNHFEENFQQLSQLIAQLNAVFDCINHSLQLTTNNRLIVSIAASNPTLSHGHTLCPAKPHHTHPSPAIATSSKIWTSQVPLEPLDLDPPSNLSTHGPSEDNHAHANKTPIDDKWFLPTHLAAPAPLSSQAHTS